ncbi:DNA-binding protein [Paraburkholderia sp. BCC1884]|uniref:DNA-binding protein n=1 Tax=Paraburkholderia sp. BCC1884 TaxID=2562668 RepID=UPI001182ED48|nr:DNA-binding protein [Paraburkholderia sp. BCC1884]
MSTDADTITDERIAAIADRMVDEGKRVSPVTIWTEVQGGSLVEIVASLQRWREARQTGAAESQVQAAVPEDLAETMMSAAGRIWAASQTEAEKAFHHRLTEASQKVDTARADRDEALTEYQKTVEEVDAERERLASVTNALTASENTAAQLGAELVTATSRAEAAEFRIDELLQRIAIQDADLDTTRTTLDEERTAREQLTEVVSNKSDAIARLTEERDLARQEVIALDDACEAKSDEVARWTEQASMASSRADTAEARIEALLQRGSALEADLDATKSTLDSTRQALDEERQAREESVALVASKTDEIALLTEARDHALQTVANLNDTVRVKSDEVAHWTQHANAMTSRAELADVRIEQLIESGLAQDAKLESTRTLLEEEHKAHRELLAEVASKTDEIVLLTGARDQALHNVANLNDAVQARTAEVARWTQDANAAVARAEAAETRNAELTQRGAALEADLAAVKSTLEESRESNAALQADVASKVDDITRVTEERDQALQHAATLSETVQARTEEVTQWTQEASTAIARAEAAESRIEQLVQSALARDANLQALKATLEEERKARDELNAVVASKDGDIARASAALQVARQEASNLADAHEVKSAEAARWSQEANAASARAESAEARIAEHVQQASTQDAALEATKASLEEERKAREELATLVSAKSDELAQVAQDRDQARQELATASKAYQTKAAEAAQLSEELSAATSREQTAGTQASESLARLAGLEASLQEARTALSAERKAAEARTGDASAQLDELRRLTAELQEAQQRVSVATEAKTATSAELDRVSQEMSAARQRAELAEQRAAKLEQRVAALSEAVAKAEQRGQHPASAPVESENAEVIAALQRQIAAQAKSHAKALDEVRTNVEQWVTHAKDLKQRLGVAGEKILFIDARSTGEVALVRRLASELERLKPDHELVARETQQKLIGATMNQQLAQKGYRYDPSTAVMSKIAG